MILKNSRHERFAQLVSEGKSATAAMKEAGYSDGRNSWRLMNNEAIRGRIDELLARGAERAEVTVASLLEELEVARQLAMQKGQASAAVQATMGKAKLTGLIVDRREVGSAGEFDHLTDEELVAEATRMARELGLLPPETGTLCLPSPTKHRAIGHGAATARR
jgi:phage terminase small subunit